MLTLRQSNDRALVVIASLVSANKADACELALV